MTALRVLLVGAGAVGQVLGHHLVRGGAEVTYFVRPQYKASVRAGIALCAVHQGHAWSVVRGVDVVDALDDVAAARWDAVVLCVGSPALVQGTWLRDLCAATGDATIVGFQPGVDDVELVRTHAGAHRVVWGMFTLMAWATTNHRALGLRTSYWRPPLSAVPLSGERVRVRPLVQALKRGGLPSKRHPDVPHALAFTGPLLDVHMVALEAVGWQLAQLRAKAMLRESFSAVREAWAVIAAKRGRHIPFALRMLRPWHMGLLVWAAPRLAPLDLQAYLAAHYTKVGEQTAAIVAAYVEYARSNGLPHRALDGLRRRLSGVRQPPVPLKGATSQWLR